MNKTWLFLVSLLASIVIVQTASAACNPCIKNSGCEQPCIDTGVCSCTETTGGNFPGCSQIPGAYQLTMSSSANSNNSWDVTASFPAVVLAPTNGCPGYAICETAHTGTGDTWEYPYMSGGHLIWSVGAEGDGTATSSTINLWPIVGTGYSTEPFGCGPTCEIQAEYTTVQAVPGQGLITQSVPGVSGQAFNCIFAREGDLGLGSTQGGIGALGSNPNTLASADNPVLGDAAYAFLILQTLWRPSGPFRVSSNAVSASDHQVTVGSGCRAFGAVQEYANSWSIFQSGNTVSMSPVPSGSVLEASCLFN